MIQKCLWSLVPLSLLATACIDDDAAVPPPEPSVLSQGDAFVALPRQVDSATATVRRDRLATAGVTPDAHGEDFYLAIHRSVLGERWFLSAFLKQYFPGGAAGGAGLSLGNRVVSFQIQNGKLFMFDVDDRAASSDTFDPQRIVEAYPIVTNPRFDGFQGIRDYVVIDPAAGLNRFDVVSDMFGRWYPTRFAVELSFLQGFQRLRDGVAYEQVFTGYAETPISADSLETNPYRASGTLGITLRRYAEGAGYHEVPAPPAPHYFLSSPRLVRNTGQTTSVAVHWNIHPGMTPIEWVIPSELVEVDQSPEYADVDLVGAVRTGIESWNQAFGFPVFKTRLARPGETYGRDDLNYIIFDRDPSYGFAFANYVDNPNTGEIRSASVYFGGTWLRRSRYQATVRAAAAPGERTFSALRWAGTFAQPLCVQWADDALELAAPGAESPSVGEKMERTVSNMIAHEVGHTLGLRHNFKGSLIAPTTSSVMEYLARPERITQGANLGSYDIDAVRYLYGLSTTLPAQPFCTDEDIGAGDPDCRPSDRGADPIVTHWQPLYRTARDAYTLGSATGPLEAAATALTEYALADGTPANRAVDVLFEGVAAPLAPDRAADPIYAQGADRVMRWILSKIGPAPSPAIAARVDEQVRAVLLDLDGARSFASRRALVDLLKARQTVAAFGLLLEARDVVAAEVARDPRDLEARDLLARIDAATTRYFE